MGSFRSMGRLGIVGLVGWTVVLRGVPRWTSVDGRLGSGPARSGHPPPPLESIDGNPRPTGAVRRRGRRPDDHRAAGCGRRAAGRGSAMSHTPAFVLLGLLLVLLAIPLAFSLAPFVIGIIILFVAGR